jgi:hypothetical protein
VRAPPPAQATTREPAPGRAAGRRPLRRSSCWPAWSALYAVLATCVVALLHLWRGDSYWNFSEGVYLASASEVLDGAGLYTELAAAQPPPIFYLGSGLLAVSDSLLFVRGALGVTTVVTGGLVAVIVGRLTGRPAVAVGAGLAALLAPWTLREHATLTPDALAPAPLLAAAVLAARPGSRSAAIAGALAALAASLKLAFLLPAAAVAVVARRRSAYLVGGVALGGLLAAASFAVWGSALWENVVEAQSGTGLQLDALPGQVAQSVWNVGPMLALAALAYVARERARDPTLLRSTAALLLGSAALIVTFLKDGTYLNTLVIVEPVAIALAVPGLVWFLEDSTVLAGHRAAASAGVTLVCVFLGLQSASVLVLPQSPVPFGNPFLSRAPGQQLTEPEVDAASEAARACPPGAPYSGSPFIAFVAHRPLPGGQADPFIVGDSPTHADLRAELRADGPLCPYRSLGGLPEGGAVEGQPK